MKTTSLDQPGERSYTTVKGAQSPRRAGTVGVTWIDVSLTESTRPEMHVTGAVITDFDEYTQLDITTGGIGGDILDLSTSETDTTLVLAPDGGGGVEWRAEGGGGSGEFLLSSGGEQHKVDVNAASGAAATIDCSLANYFDITLTANCTLSIINPPPSGKLGQILVARRQGGSGSYTEAWPANVYGQATNGTSTAFAPTLHTAVGAVNLALLSTLDGGGSWGATELGDSGGVSGFATPAIVLGTAAGAGSATTTIRSDSTIVAFDTTVPAAIGAAATGSVAKAARRDHVHNTGAGTPSTQALGDAASTGTGPAAAMTDHKHAMPALSTAVPLVEAGTGAVGTATPSSREDHVHPAAAASGGHGHVANEQHLSDGATGLYTLDAYYEPESVIAWNTTTIARLTVTETLPDQATVSPVGSSGDKIIFDYAASVA